MADFAAGEHFFDGDFENALDFIEVDGSVAGKDGLDCSFNVRIEFEMGGFGVGEPGAGFVQFLLVRLIGLSAAFLIPLSLLRFKANLFFLPCGSKL